MTASTSHSSARTTTLGIAILLLCASVCALFPARGAAQVATAAINGTVTDPSGASVPGATVVLKNVATNVERSTVTNETGNYVLVDIPPGRYTLKVTKEGFTTATQREFELSVNQTTAFDFALKVGSAVETITVEAAAASIQTSTSELGTVINTRTVDNLPLNGRNFTQLLSLTPGVSTVNTSQNANNKQFDGNPLGQFNFPSINGQTNRSNFYLLDGLNDQESFSSTYSVPPVLDDIQEFKVDSHNDQAQFGGVLGGVVNVATKSGTNDFHGTAWEFFRNDALDSRNPFVQTRPSLHQNQFGANIGGPVILPHYNGRNRTFFFGSYEGVRLHFGNTTQTQIPTPAQINGDFTGLLDSQKRPIQIYNPWSAARDPFRCDSSGNPLPVTINANGTRTQDQNPLVGSSCQKIPQSLMDTHMQAFARAYWPTPTSNFNDPLTGNNYQATLLNTQSPDSYNIRVDEQLGPKDAIWGRFSHAHAPSSTPGIFGQSAVVDYNAHQMAVSWNHTFGPSTMLSVQFGRNYGYSANPTLLPQDVSTKLIQAAALDQTFACGFTNGPRSCYLMEPQFSGLPSSARFGESSSPAKITDIWQWKANFFKTHGRHSFSTGFDFNTNGFQQTFNSGHFDFSAAQTSNPGTGGGYSVASFILGVPDAATYRNVFETEYGGWVRGFYFQDQWRVTDRLTLNWGARYDYTLFPVYGSDADNNNQIGDLDLNTGTYILERSAPDCATTGNKPPCIPGLTANGLPAHVLLSPNGKIVHNTYDNIQPRLGIAYRVREKTVLRSSFGRFFDNWAAVIQMAQNFQGTWPSTAQLIVANLNQAGTPPTVFAENPFSGGAAMPAATPFSQNNWFVDPLIQNPYSYQWNFGIQQALTPSTVLTVNYVGSTNHRLDSGDWENVATTPCPKGSPSCPSIQARAPFSYIGQTHYERSWGKAWYHALQTSLDKKSSKGLSYLLSYTWSKTENIGVDGWFGADGASIQDPYHLQNDKGLAGFDVPHIFTASSVYELPFGKGKKFQSGNRVLDGVFGNWQLNGILSLSSGRLFNVSADKTIPNTGNNWERPNLVDDPHLANPTPVLWFNTAAFVRPADGTFGNFGRNVLRGDGRTNLDLSVFRSFPITESKRLEFRAEAFNATNTPVWDIPTSANSDVNAPKFGAISGISNGTPVGAANSLRNIQFALKVYY